MSGGAGNMGGTTVERFKALEAENARLRSLLEVVVPPSQSLVAQADQPATTSEDTRPVVRDADAIRGTFYTLTDGDVQAGAGAFASDCVPGTVCFWAEVREGEGAEFYLTPKDAQHLASVLHAAALGALRDASSETSTTRPTAKRSAPKRGAA